MKILTICGSARPASGNRRLLSALSFLWPEVEIAYFSIHTLPLFGDLPDQQPETSVNQFREAASLADKLVITTPEYAHNLPAALKNALEWLVSSGELLGKKVLPITLTPHPPRGEKTMTSLCWTLAALDMNIVTQLPLFSADVSYLETGALAECPAKEMLLEAFLLLKE